MPRRRPPAHPPPETPGAPGRPGAPCARTGAQLTGVLLLGALAAGCTGMGPGLSPGMMGPSRMPLEAFVSTRVDSSGADHPEVRVAVPYRSLIFRRENGTFVSEIQVTAVARLDGRRVGGGVGRAVARVDGYPATRGPEKLHCRVPLQVRGEGPVELEVAVEVRESSRVWERKFVYRPQAARRVPLYFSSFGWNLDAREWAGQVLGVGLDSLRVAIGLQRRPGGAQWPPGGLQLVARIEEALQERPLVQRVPLAESDLRGDSLRVELGWPARDIYFGRCRLRVQLVARLADGPEELSLDPPRPFTNLQVPFGDERQWQRHVAWLDGILDGDGRRELASLPAGERETAWRSVFAGAARAAGVPAAELETRHLMRIVEADARFGGFGRGALSDRGRIYIRHGPPDRMQHYGDDMAREGRWEVWYYLDAGLQFTFYDPHGLGDFQLYQTRTI